jgi:hypothetical protein
MLGPACWRRYGVLDRGESHPLLVGIGGGRPPNTHPEPF